MAAPTLAVAVPSLAVAWRRSRPRAGYFQCPALSAQTPRLEGGLDRIGERGGSAAADDPGRNADRNRLRRNIFGDDGARADHGAPPNTHAVQHRHVRAQPNVVLDLDALAGQALLVDRHVQTVEVMVGRDNHAGGGDQHVVADLQAAVPVEYAVGIDAGPASDADIASVGMDQGAPQHIALLAKRDVVAPPGHHLRARPDVGPRPDPHLPAHFGPEIHAAPPQPPAYLASQAEHRARSRLRARPRTTYAMPIAACNEMAST